jgi:hypothetical protein
MVRVLATARNKPKSVRHYAFTVIPAHIQFNGSMAGLRMGFQNWDLGSGIWDSFGHWRLVIGHSPKPLINIR